MLVLDVLLGALVAGLFLLSAAQTEAAPPPQSAERPFGLPFNTPPGPSTWFITQFYGNTESSFVWRYHWYGNGQGMHFGIDLAAKCGTEVVAIGDGVVSKVDATAHGAGPHNLMIDHPDAGYASFYGHLMQAPQLAPGDPVMRGQVVGLTGDPDVTCTSRPHLHLEIRSLSYWVAYNPVALIDADWDTLSLLGRSQFQRDLNDPRRWVTPYDQPDIHFGQEILNDYDSPWPPDWSY